MNAKKYPAVLQILFFSMLFLLLILQIYGLATLHSEMALKHTAALTRCFTASMICATVMVSIYLVKSEYSGKARKDAYVDVTGVHNKSACMEKMRQLEERDNTFGIGIAMFDLNNLKKINDYYGHDKGDELIEAFAQLLRTLPKERCFLARFGGDEFILIQEKTSAAQMHQIISTLQQRTQEYNKKNAIPIEFASGFAVSDRRQYFIISDLLKEADKKMYENKRESKKQASEQKSIPSCKKPVVAELCQSQTEVHQSALETTDAMTGLLTRDAFLVKAESILRSSQADVSTALVCMDISNFHDINDNLGYPCGDQALQILAQEIIKEKYVLCACRIHADMFAFLLMTTEKTQEDVLHWLQAENLYMSRKVFRKSCNQRFKINMGVSFVQDRLERPAHLLNHANLARKRAKSSEESIVVYSDALDRLEKQRASILRDFRSAIQKNEIKLYFQPQVDSQSEQICGAEALARWITAGATVWTPNEFIPVLEHSGDIILLDYYMYRKAFEWLAHRRQCGKQLLTISLNISRIHLSDVQSFITYIQRLQSQYAVPVEYLIFEVTENAYIENMERVAQLIEGLHTLGIRVSMDDFGSGYASLKALQLLPFDEIKIDKSFLMQGLCETERVILHAVIGLMKQLQKNVVCEGVETKEGACFLQREGCDMLQGFYYSAAITIPELEKKLDVLPFKQKLSS